MVVVWLVCVTILQPSCVGTADTMVMSVVLRHDSRVHHIDDHRGHDGRVYSRSMEYTRRSCPYYRGTTVVSVTSVKLLTGIGSGEGACLAPGKNKLKTIMSSQIHVARW